MSIYKRDYRENLHLAESVGHLCLYVFRPMYDNTHAEWCRVLELVFKRPELVVAELK